MDDGGNSIRACWSTFQITGNGGLDRRLARRRCGCASRRARTAALTQARNGRPPGSAAGWVLGSAGSDAVNGSDSPSCTSPTGSWTTIQAHAGACDDEQHAGRGADDQQTSAGGNMGRDGSEGVVRAVLVEYRGGVDASRRITVAVGVSMFVDAALYLAVIPLLPHYVDRFGLSTPAGRRAWSPRTRSRCRSSRSAASRWCRGSARSGSRVVSAALMTVSTRDLRLGAQRARAGARPVRAGPRQSGTIWTASMAWVTDNAPPGRRGRESGIVMGMLSAGSVAGPAVGALASWAGQGVAFGAGRRGQPGRAGAGCAGAGRAQRGPPGADPLRAAPRAPGSGRPWRRCR